MADVQLENGYIRIANSLLDAALKYPFTLRQQSAFFAVVRLTYGYGKKADRMSASQIAERTGMARGHAAKALKELADLNVIERKKVGAQMFEISINKDFESWGADTKTVSPTDTNPVSGTDTESVSELSTTDTDLVAHRYQNGIETDTESVHTKDKRHISKDSKSKALLGSSSKSKGEKTFEQRNAEATAEAVRRRHEHLFKNNPEALDHAEAELRFKLELGHDVPNPSKYFLAIAKDAARNPRHGHADSQPRETFHQRIKRKADAQIARLHDAALGADGGSL